MNQIEILVDFNRFNELICHWSSILRPYTHNCYITSALYTPHDSFLITKYWISFQNKIKMINMLQKKIIIIIASWAGVILKTIFSKEKMSKNAPGFFIEYPHPIEGMLYVLKPRYAGFFTTFCVDTEIFPNQDRLAYWRHLMETFYALLAFCAGNSPVPGEFPAQRPVTRSFDVFFDLCLNKPLRKRWWFETPSRPLWRHCNGHVSPQPLLGILSWYTVKALQLIWR